MKITAKTKICMVIGYPVEHSLGPKIYNAIYKVMGIDSEYVYIGCKVKIEDISDFLKGIRAMNIRGVSCTIPHKIAVLPYLDKIDKVANKIGAVNTIVNDNGILTGYNTDWLGATIPLEKITSLKNKHVAILGAGGAARAVAYGIIRKGGKVTIFNRTFSNAEKLAKDFKCEYFSLDEIKNVNKTDIIINTTSVGLHPQIDETPLPKKFISDKHIVFDAVYVPYETRLLKEAKEQGATIIHGTEMLLQQGLAQFKLYTGLDAPEEKLRNILLENVR